MVSCNKRKPRRTQIEPQASALVLTEPTDSRIVGNSYLIALCQSCPSLVRRLVGVSRWQPSSPDRARDGDLLEIRNDRFASRYRVLHGGQR